MDVIARRLKSMSQDDVEFVYENSGICSRGVIHYYRIATIPAHKGAVTLFYIFDEFEKIIKEIIEFLKE